MTSLITAWDMDDSVKSRSLLCVAGALSIHAFLFALGYFLLPDAVLHEAVRPSSRSLRVEIVSQDRRKQNRPLREGSLSAASNLPGTPRSGRSRSLNLGLDFALNSASPHLEAPHASKGAREGISQESRTHSQDLLATESKVWRAFDSLAEKIGSHLEYPLLLSENGITGNATLDLYFDGNGEVDEGRSKTYGDARSLRGLLIKATRHGLMDWIPSDAPRLAKSQFRNQHFRADFILAHSQVDTSETLNPAPGSYLFTRRRVSNTACIGQIDGSPLLNAACLAAKAQGAILRSYSRSYRNEFELLKERLEQFDQIGLDGIKSSVAQRESFRNT
jgi:hypothetical protein